MIKVVDNNHLTTCMWRYAKIPRTLSGVLVFLMLCQLHAHAQRNLSGKVGLIYIPTAEETTDGELVLGYNYNPANYGLRSNNNQAEQIIYANLAFLPRLDFTFALLQTRANGKRVKSEALGDRQIDVRWVFLRENSRWPSMAIVMSSPFTIDAAMGTHAVVATKHLKITDDIMLEGSLGYGSPWYLYRDEENLNNYNVLSKFTWQRKSEDKFDSNYLVGTFGGIKATYKNKYSFMSEWDGQHFNVGLHANIFKTLHAQAGLLNFDQLMWGVNYAIPLN